MLYGVVREVWQPIRKGEQGESESQPHKDSDALVEGEQDSQDMAAAGKEERAPLQGSGEASDGSEPEKVTPLVESFMSELAERLDGQLEDAPVNPTPRSPNAPSTTSNSSSAPPPTPVQRLLQYSKSQQESHHTSIGVCRSLMCRRCFHVYKAACYAGNIMSFVYARYTRFV